MTAEQVKLDVPWFVLTLTAVGVLGSAAVATAAIGPGHADLQLPAALTYAIPVVIHATSVYATWLRARSTDLRLRRATRQVLIATAGILVTVGAVATQARLGHWDVPAMIAIGVLSGVGPLILAVVFFPPGRSRAS